ncbi:MAG: CotH kinase family protein [Ignavibacteriales bacterium]|nr:CotH kinase family protein [Ignavibacteriales bacterium]
MRTKNLRSCLLLPLFFFLHITAKAQNPGDNVFDGIRVHAIKINFYQPGYWDTLVYNYEQGGKQYMPASVTIDDVTFDSCGVRLKGNSSYRHPNDKKSMKISFDKFRSGQTWDDLKNIHLNNCYGDPSFMREKIHLDFCRDAGIISPRANYANVFINDTLFAFYTLVEDVDKKFLDSHFGNNGGDLFKAIDVFERSQISSDFAWYTAVPDSYYTRYELQTDESTTAWQNLVTLLDTLNNNSNASSALQNKIDLTPLYKAITTDLLFANLDSYSSSGRNFYFYFNPADNKMEWIVWDAGLSFGGYGGGVSNFEKLSITYSSSSVKRPLTTKIFNTPELKNEYLDSFCLLFNSFFSSERLSARIDSIANIIRPFVYADQRKQYTNSQFEINLLSDLSSGGVGGSSRIPGLKSFITARQTNVQSQLASLGVNCTATVSAGDVVINEFMAQNNSIFDSSGEAEDWIELHNNTSQEIDLSYFYLSDDFLQPLKWQFPNGVVIAPDGYLIVWADEETGEDGLHSSFKLSANGEQLILSSSNFTILDTISFGVQSSNISMARIPNGSGAFMQSEPTFNADNDDPASVNEEKNIPSEFILEQNYPNPFNPATTIEFRVSGYAFVSLKVFDILGREVTTLVNEFKQAGKYSVEFGMQLARQGGNAELPSGIYFYTLRVNPSANTGQIYSSVRKMILIK